MASSFVPKTIQSKADQPDDDNNRRIIYIYGDLSFDINNESESRRTDDMTAMSLFAAVGSNDVDDESKLVADNSTNN